MADPRAFAEDTVVPVHKSRYPHAYAFDGPSGGAGSGRCGHCGVSDEDESADMECPVRLRQALNEALGDAGEGQGAR